MALRVGELYALLKLEDREFQRGLQRAEQETRKFGRSLEDTIKRLDNLSKTINDMGQKLTTRITLPLVGLSTYLVKTASDAEQTEEKFRVSFGAMAEASLQLADQLARDQQRARVHLQNMMADAQAILAPMTENREAAAQMSAALAALAVDLGSFMNMADREAFDRLISGLLGSTEATERLGISLRESVLQLEAQRLGIEANVATLGDAEKIMLRFSAIMRQSADAQTDAIRTGASFENQLKALQADVADLAAEMGQELLPYALALVQVGRDLVQHWRNLSPEAKELAIQIAAIAAAAGPLALGLSAIVRAGAGVGRVLVLINALARRNPWVLLATLAAVAALSVEKFRQELNELGRALGLGGILDELEDLQAAFQELMSFEVDFDPAGASAEALERQKQLYQQAMEEIQRVLREGFQGAAELAEEGAAQVAEAFDPWTLIQRLGARPGIVPWDLIRDTILGLDEQTANDVAKALERVNQALTDGLFLRAELEAIRYTEGLTTEVFDAAQRAVVQLEELERAIETLGQALPPEHPLIRYLMGQYQRAASMAPSLAEQFYRDLQAELRRIGAEALLAEAAGDVFDDLQAELEARRAYVLRLIIDADVKPATDSVQQQLARIAEIQEEIFRRRMAELAARAQEALSPFGPGAVAERLALYRGERVLPPWLDEARRQAIAAGDMQRLAQLAEQHSLVYLDAQIEALDRIIDEMVREIQARTGEVNIYDLLSSPELMGVLRDRSQLAAERAVTAWQYELADIQDELARALDTVEIERLLAAVTGEEFDEATAKWRAVERAIWAVVRAGEEHGRTIEDVLPMVEKLVGQYGHLAQRVREASDPLAALREQLRFDLGPGMAIQRLVSPAFDELQYEIDRLTRFINDAATTLNPQTFGQFMDAVGAEVEQLQELLRRQEEQLRVQDAINSALDGFAQGLADGNRVLQDFMRLLRWEQGGLRFDMGGLWSLGANILGQFVGALFAGARAQLPEPRRFEAPDPYMYGLAVAREQRSELEAELRRLQQRLAAERERLAREESSLWNRWFRQDILNYWRDRIRLTEQEIANLESALGSFDMASFLGIDPGNIARAIESGFDMVDLSRLGESLEDVIRTALVRAWVTSEEMVRLQTQFRDLLQQVVDEFIQHGELRADALDPLRAVIEAIQERGEALQEVLRQLGLTSEELNEQFSRMVYNLPLGYRVERAIFEASPPRIPALAAGGIVTRPTLALVGEAGPEAVVPLDRGGIGGVYVHIERMEVQDGRDFGRRLDEELRRRGLVRAGNVTAWGGRR